MFFQAVFFFGKLCWSSNRSCRSFMGFPERNLQDSCRIPVQHHPWEFLFQGFRFQFYSTQNPGPPFWIHGTMVYLPILPTWLLDFDGFHVGKYLLIPWYLLWGMDSSKGLPSNWDFFSGFAKCAKDRSISKRQWKQLGSGEEIQQIPVFFGGGRVAGR